MEKEIKFSTPTISKQHLTDMDQNFKFTDYEVGRHQEEIHGGRPYLAAEPADREIGRLILALEEIADPVKFMRKNLQEGEALDGQYAYMLSNDANHLKQIARKALNKPKE